jgi:hypothetical protein
MSPTVNKLCADLLGWTAEENRTEGRKGNWKYEYVDNPLGDVCADTHAHICVPITTTDLQSSIAVLLSACNLKQSRSKWNLMFYSCLTCKLSRGALSVLPRSRCNWRGVGVTLLTHTHNTHTKWQRGLRPGLSYPTCTLRSYVRISLGVCCFLRLCCAV